MAFVATPVAPLHWVATFGGFGAAAIATGSRGRATIDFVGAFSDVRFSVAVASTSPVAAT